MTRDAKVGLLLGLIFIFVIAFIINGLPGFHGRDDGNELTRNLARPVNSQTPVGTAARQVTRDTITPVRPARTINPIQNPTSLVMTEPTNTKPFAEIHNRSTVRYTTELPDTKKEERILLKAPQDRTTSAVERVLAQSRQQKPQKVIKVKPTAKSRTIKRAKIYTVKEGDSLAVIAKKIYGDQLGNKQATINSIFKANRKILKSPDNIYIGQKLIMPVIGDTNNEQSIFSSDKFKPVASVGARTKTKVSANYYTVKENDNLWKIAEKELGNGSRYTEILKLNSKQLEDENMLIPGAQLKLPSK